jgi:hypothetical protein
MSAKCLTCSLPDGSNDEFEGEEEVNVDVDFRNGCVVIGGFGNKSGVTFVCGQKWTSFSYNCSERVGSQDMQRYCL